MSRRRRRPADVVLQRAPHPRLDACLSRCRAVCRIARENFAHRGWGVLRVFAGVPPSSPLLCAAPSPGPRGAGGRHAVPRDATPMVLRRGSTGTFSGFKSPSSHSQHPRRARVSGRPTTTLGCQPGPGRPSRLVVGAAPLLRRDPNLGRLWSTVDGRGDLRQNSQLLHRTVCPARHVSDVAVRLAVRAVSAATWFQLLTSTRRAVDAAPLVLRSSPAAAGHRSAIIQAIRPACAGVPRSATGLR